MMRRFAALVLCLVFCCTMIPAALADEPSGVEDGVLTVAMECNYAPYNWSQGDDSNGAVPIRDSREYANGYDVMMAKKLCEANGWQLEIVRLDWDSLVPAVQAGVVDAVIAGQSMTASRAEMVDFAGPYLYASIVCLAKQGTPQAAAKGISELSGYCTSQLGTIWYDSCLPQIAGAKIQSPAESAPAPRRRVPLCPQGGIESLGCSGWRPRPPLVRIFAKFRGGGIAPKIKISRPQTDGFLHIELF